MRPQLIVLWTAAEHAGRVALYCILPLIAVSVIEPAHAFAPWLIPLAAAVTEFALTVGTTGWRGAIRDAVGVGVEVAVPSVAFTVLWPVADVGTVGHAILVAGPAFLIATAVEFGKLVRRIRFDVFAQRELATSAAEAVEREDPAASSSVDLDARLAYRYQRARKEAEAEVRRYLPANPRTAKRMVNHVSLAMAIAEQRGLFRDPDITQQHLAKWIGISEQWPALGAALTTKPSRMEELEQAATVPELQAMLDDLAPGTVASEEMVRRLGDGDLLGGLLDRLVRYEPG